MATRARAQQQQLHPSIGSSVRVDMGRRGKWVVAVSGQPRPIRCDTLDDASRAAHRIADGRQPCELIVRDAYHRVICREYGPC